MLAILLGAAVGGFIVLVGRGSSDNGVSLVALEAGRKLLRQDEADRERRGVAVPAPERAAARRGHPTHPAAVEPSTQETPISHIALAQSTAPEDIKVFDTSNSVEYVLCGVGSRGGRCAIGEGKATTERARLLHRESLELALYTFKYVDGVDSVVTLQPPRAGADPTFATFFQKDDFKEELAHPLRQTLEGASPFTTSDFPVAQQARVSQIVTPFLFRFSYQQAPDLSAVMVLQPLAA